MAVVCRHVLAHSRDGGWWGPDKNAAPPRLPQQPATCATPVAATRVLPMGYRGRLCPAHCPAFAMESTLSEWRRLIFFFFLEIMVML